MRVLHPIHNLRVNRGDFCFFRIRDPDVLLLELN